MMDMYWWALGFGILVLIISLVVGRFKGWLDRSER
jgi:hypothetical protein